MKIFGASLGLLVLAASTLLVLSACGGGDKKRDVAEGCKVQLSEDDCLTIGNNILAFSEGLENYECAWKENACIMQSTQTPN